MKALHYIIPAVLMIGTTLIIKFTEFAQFWAAMLWVASGFYILFKAINYLTNKKNL